MDRLLLRPTEAAEALGLSRSRLYELLGTGEIPALRVGKCRRVPAEELRKWVRERAQLTEAGARE